MSRILAIEAATEHCSVALRLGDSYLVREKVVARDHSRLLLPYVLELLAEADCALSSLDAVAVGQGPGSFTGVRIAISAAQGLAFGADLPLAAVSSLAALSLSAYPELANGHVLAAFDARMGQVYWACYQLKQGQHQLIGDEAVLNPDAAVLPANLLVDESTEKTKLYAAGHGWRAYADVLNNTLAGPGLSLLESKPDALPGARAVAQLATDTQWQAPEQVAAVYLRDKVTY